MRKVDNKKKIWAIWAEDSEHLIGANDRLPWHLPAELAHFKKTTMGSVILMGRPTFEGMNRRILPGRKTLVMTHDSTYQVEGVETVTSVEQALEWFQQQDKDLYIIGGAGVFDSFKDAFDGLIRTQIHGTFEGDTYFTSLNFEDYQKISETFHAKDEQNAYDFTVSTWIKKQ